jgi:HSF-type DNA-binding
VRNQHHPPPHPGGDPQFQSTPSEPERPVAAIARELSAFATSRPVRRELGGYLRRFQLYFIFSSGSAGAAAQQQHESAKTRPKRRRKPQKPGKTAKLNDRHFVVHNYHDHSHDPDDADDEDQSSSYEDHHHHSSSFEHGDEGRRRGGVAVAFPLKLHAVLDQVERDGYSHVISWSPHGRCFVIHKPKQFTEEVMPKYV